MAFTNYDYSSGLAALGQGLGNISRGFDEQFKRQTLAKLGEQIQNGDYDAAARAAFSAGDASTGLGLLKLGQTAKQESDWLKANSGLLGGGAPAGATAAPASIGAPNEIESRFINTVKGAGLTNPVGLAAVAATGKAESGYAPQNVNRTWNDPSVSGQPGTAGGIMSWRADRLTNLMNFARSRGETQPSVETQALFLAQEDPTLIPKLQAAKTPQEASQIMANAWRFAGFNREGGENARRLALTQGYAQRFGWQGGPAPVVPVQVAENEADVARIEAQMPGYGGGQPAQVAQTIQGDDPAKLRADAQYYAQSNPEAARQMIARADAIENGRGVQVAQAAPQPGAPVAAVPAPGAVNAQGFAVPGGDPVPQSIANDPRVLNLQRALAGAPERFKPSIQSRLNILVEELKAQRQQSAPTDVQKNYELARRQGYQGSLLDYQKELRAQTNVNVDTGPKLESAYASSNGKAISDRFSKIVEEGDAANAEVGTLARIRELGGQIKNIGSGAALQGWLAERGIKVGPNVSEIEAYGALIDKLTPQQRIAGAGATSDYDARMFKNSLPGLMRTPGGNELILSTLEALNTYKRQRGDIVAEAMANNEKPPEVLKRLKELPDPFAGFKEAAKGGFKNVPEAPPSVPTPPAPPQRGEIRANTIDDVRGLPSGTIFIDPNGVKRRVP